MVNFRWLRGYIGDKNVALHKEGNTWKTVVEIFAISHAFVAESEDLRDCWGESIHYLGPNADSNFGGAISGDGDAS